MKVIIIGAGIAGLTLAHACRQAGIEVKLYDKAQQLRNIGGGILLWPHGVRYLKWLGLEACLQPFSVSIEGCNIIGHDGQQIFSENYAEINALLGGSILPIDRSAFQQALLTQLPDNLLQLNKACVRVETDEHQAHVIFADGTEDSADIIIGADGIHSTVRKSLHPLVQPEYTHYCWWGGIIEQKYLPNLTPDRVFVALGVKKICMIWPASNDRFMWYLPVKMPLADFQTNDPSQQLHAICKDWHPHIESLINAPAVAQSFQLPIYAVAPQPSWSNNRVVLIGDAAHALGPILGQGASQAIEDVYILINCLQRTTLAEIPNILSHYELLRKNKYAHLAALENQTAMAMISEDLASLKAFEAQAAELSLAMMYKDLIPFIDENACLLLARYLSNIDQLVA